MVERVSELLHTPPPRAGKTKFQKIRNNWIDSKAWSGLNPCFHLTSYCLEEGIARSAAIIFSTKYHFARWEPMLGCEGEDRRLLLGLHFLTRKNKIYAAGPCGKIDAYLRHLGIYSNQRGIFERNFSFRQEGCDRSQRRDCPCFGVKCRLYQLCAAVEGLYDDRPNGFPTCYRTSKARRGSWLDRRLSPSGRPGYVRCMTSPYLAGWLPRSRSLSELLWGSLPISLLSANSCKTNQIVPFQKVNQLNNCGYLVLFLSLCSRSLIHLKQMGLSRPHNSDRWWLKND